MATEPPSNADSQHAAQVRKERRRLAELEIARRKSRARLARLLAQGEEEEAARLAKQLDIRLPADGVPVDQPSDAQAVARWLDAESPMPPTGAGAPEGPPSDAAVPPGGEPAPPAADEGANPFSDATPAPAASVSLPESLPSVPREDRAGRKKRLPGPAVPISLLAHVALVLVLGLVSFAIQSNQRLMLESNAIAGEDPLDDFAEVSLESQEIPFDELSPELEPSDLSDELLEEFDAPLELAAPSLDSPADAVFDALPTEMAGLMAGEVGGDSAGGSGGSAAAAASPGSPGGAQFFGSRSRGNRFVFVVDNSGSMRDGRMETTLLELMRTIRGMDSKQQFHVLFFSDQVYPMFFPQAVEELVPATRDNRAKLDRWLGTVQISIGARIRDAMDYAASLDPHVVYLLCDGVDLSHPTYGRRNLEHMIGKRGEWNFAIHTLGMNVRNRESAQALASLAQAFGGGFTPVGVTPAALQIHRQRPVAINRERTTEGRWGSKIR